MLRELACAMLMVVGSLHATQALVISNMERGNPHPIEVKCMPFEEQDSGSYYDDSFLIHRGKNIEKIVMISSQNYEKCKKNRCLRCEDLYNFSQRKSLEPLYKALNDLPVQIVGYDFTRGGVIELYVEPKESSFIEPSFFKTCKKARIARRRGIYLSEPLQARFVSFTAMGLPKAQLDGVVGLLTSSGQMVLARSCGQNKPICSTAQITLYGAVGNSFLAAKGTAGCAASPKQRKILEKFGTGVDIVINLDECLACQDTNLPLEGEKLTIAPERFLIMRAWDSVGKSQNDYSLKTLLFIRSEEISHAFLDHWLAQIDQVPFDFQEKKISCQEARDKLLSLAYKCDVPSYSRYLWADESLPLEECHVPYTLHDTYSVGDKVLILSHPLLFDMNYAVLTVTGYTAAPVWALNPELSHRLQRDHDGDIITIPDPKIIRLQNNHIPSAQTFLPKKENEEELCSNGEVLSFLLAKEQFSEPWNARQCLALYYLLLQNRHFDLIEEAKHPLSCFLINSTLFRKKKIEPSYRSTELPPYIEKLLKQVQLEDHFLKNEEYPLGMVTSELDHRIFCLTGNIIKGKGFQGLNLKESTNIDLVDTIWNRVTEALTMINTNPP